MKENPANAIKDTMWKFLMDKGQKSNIPALKFKRSEIDDWIKREDNATQENSQGD